MSVFSACYNSQCKILRRKSFPLKMSLSMRSGFLSKHFSSFSWTYSICDWDLLQWSTKEVVYLSNFFSNSVPVQTSTIKVFLSTWFAVFWVALNNWKVEDKVRYASWLDETKNSIACQANWQERKYLCTNCSHSDCVTVFYDIKV